MYTYYYSYKSSSYYYYIIIIRCRALSKSVSRSRQGGACKGDVVDRLQSITAGRLLRRGGFARCQRVLRQRRRQDTDDNPTAILRCQSSHAGVQVAVGVGVGRRWRYVAAAAAERFIIVVRILGIVVDVAPSDVHHGAVVVDSAKCRDDRTAKRQRTASCVARPTSAGAAYVSRRGRRPCTWRWADHCSPLRQRSTAPRRLTRRRTFRRGFTFFRLDF